MRTLTVYEVDAVSGGVAPAVVTFAGIAAIKALCAGERSMAATASMGYFGAQVLVGKQSQPTGDENS